MTTEVAPHVDLLTGAYKREHLEAEVTRAVAEVRKRRLPLCLLHVDIDELQEHNDLHGREALDKAISWLAARISEVVDGLGPIGRLGGDEFAILLRGIPLERAKRLAEKLRRLVAQTDHLSERGSFRLTLSVGVAALRANEPPGNLLDAAEEACVRAKQAGRDGVVAR